ncbi:glycosidase [Aquimarina sp. EL_43]|uniref:glycoside hydrolase family 13 protein n=1 Tax=unclassified Aquimarina TaxID=2627091 RepID=UPI0018C9734E|nr:MULTISPECIES: glycoside hydrolase family 13 protein [unclassified Aquimarina]MBG6132190.1 glycosidase [Aquimarina sp. EL_35]MBG6152987.1 glycosidase [Aquimarina sp. EL_32]MBG6170994.1 glycosidase [Aquimarina sp. EL_43]
MKSKLIVLFSFCLVALTQAQVEKMEPPFWWSAMHNDELQILCYGKGIAKYNVESKDIKISDITKTENPNYLFITLDIKEVEAGTVSIDFKENGNVVFSQPYQFKSRRENSAERKGFDSSDVMYLIMPDRFANGNPENDSHKDTVEKADRSNPGGRHGGDIQGVIDHLDYLKDLGVTALWSTPLLEDNEPTYSYHTYAQSDLYSIDPRYGTNEDYKRLASEMHKQDMKLVMDYVTNHWGSKHWMIKDLPTKDWIHQWPEGFRRSNYRMTTQFDDNASQIDSKGCMNGWFDTTMPDMNQSNPLLLKYITQNAIWWIEYADLDGFRVDTYSYNDKEGIAKWTKAIMDEYPNFNIVGEVWMHNQSQIAYWQKNSKIGAIDNYNSHLPSVMDFTLHDAITVLFNEDENSWDKGMIRAYNNFTNDFLYPDINNILLFAGNHDTNRINEIYQGDIDIYKMVMTLIFTTRGIPQIYYGDEIGMLGNRDKKGDGDIRRDFPGGWPGDTKNAFLSSETKNGRTNDQEVFHSFTSKVLKWRQKANVIHTGKLLQFIPFDNVYVYFRYNEEKSVMVIINNSLKDQKIDITRFKEGIKNYSVGTDIITDSNIDITEDFSIPAKTSMILDLK